MNHRRKRSRGVRRRVGKEQRLYRTADRMKARRQFHADNDR